MSICVVSFSSRGNGNCAKISEFVCSLLSDTVRYSFSDFEIHPCGNCNYECFTRSNQCPWISDKEYELLEAITKSTLTYFILPNYCDYPCANFFVFNERSLCYFQSREDLLDEYENVPKKVIVVSNTNQEHFQAAMSYHSSREPEMLFLSAKKYGKASVDGDLLTSEQAIADLKGFVLGDESGSVPQPMVDFA